MNATRLKSTSLVVALAALTTSATAADLQVPAEHATIQAAVNAASDGDTIHIAAGVYREQVNIVQKDLTLIGEPGTILRAVPYMDSPSGFDDYPVRCILFVHLSTNVVLEHLCFEGDQLGAEQDFDFYGALYLDSGGTVENCQFTGFRMSPDNSGDAEYLMIALAFFNDLPSAKLLQARVANTTIVDSYQGIFAEGVIERIVLDLDIENNTIQGVGPSPVRTRVGAIWAMRLGHGVTGRVRSNTISGFSYRGNGAKFPFNPGILAHGGGWPDFPSTFPIRFENNTLRDNDVHLFTIKGSQHEIIGNRFIGSGEGERGIGVWVSEAEEADSAALIRENIFEALPVGILAAGEDPDFDTNFGVAQGTQIVDNRFRDVATPIEIQPAGSALESGTLVHPFPEPELGIVRSVNLSWPDYYADDYLLEGAPTPEGPWTEVAARVEWGEGALQTTVELEGEQQYFRLSASSGIDSLASP